MQDWERDRLGLSKPESAQIHQTGLGLSTIMSTMKVWAQDSGLSNITIFGLSKLDLAGNGFGLSKTGSGLSKHEFVQERGLEFETCSHSTGMVIAAA